MWKGTAQLWEVPSGRVIKGGPPYLRLCSAALLICAAAPDKDDDDDFFTDNRTN